MLSDNITTDQITEYVLKNTKMTSRNLFGPIVKLSMSTSTGTLFVFGLNSQTKNCVVCAASNCDAIYI